MSGSTGSLPVAGRWFESRRVDAAVTFLTEPHAHPLLRCNIWLVAGASADMLVDTGLGIASLAEALAPLRETERPLVTVATHVHYDHAGGLHEFDDCRIHSAELAQMADYREFAALRAADFPAPILADLAAAGLGIDGDWLIDAVPHAEFDPERYRVRSVEARALESGDVIDLGNTAFEVLHLPGHTPGSIGLWDASSGTLFSGDAIYDGVLLDTLPESDLVAYERTMRYLLELPVRVVHGGHEPSFGRERLRAIARGWLDGRAA